MMAVRGWSRCDMVLTFMLAILAADLIVGLVRLCSPANHQLTVSSARLLAAKEVSFTFTLTSII